MRHAAAVLVAAMLVLLLAAVGAEAATTSVAVPAPVAAAGPTGTTGVTSTAAVDPNVPVNVSDLDAKQPGYRLIGRQVLAIAARSRSAKEVVGKYKGAYPGAYTKGPGRWQVSYFSRDTPPKEIAQLYISDATAKVTEQYTGYKVPWTMARGYAGAFGRTVNSPWVWIPLTLAFLLPFLRTRGVRFDLLVLAAFGISVAYFNDAQIDKSVPLVYPLLAYLGLRSLWIGLRREERPRAPMKLLFPVSVMAVALVFLIGFRIALDVSTSNVIDVGYAGVIGADKLEHGQPIYGTFPKDNEHGDTYGPVTYAAYVPFVKAFGWSGRWDSSLPAAHAAAIAFDLICIGLLFLLGRRMRGPTLGIVLAYLWAAFPFSLYTLMSNSNDALVAVFVLLALYVAASPSGRGAAAALGGLTKFATLALGPLYAMHGLKRTRLHGLLVFTFSFLVVTAIATAPVYLNHQSLHTVYDRTLGFQTGRGSPFSIWGLYDLPGLQHAWQAVAVLLAVGLALVPRRRDVVGLAACSAVVVIALQAGVTHWFYLYVVWFFPLVAVALFARYDEAVLPETTPDPERDPPLEADPSQATSTGSMALA